MGTVRPLLNRDIPQVSDLHRRVFQIAPRMTLGLETAYENYFTTIFLNHPRATVGSSSLVCEENGAIIGFLGVTTQPMCMQNRAVMAAVGSQLIVDASRRSTLAGVQLLKAFFSGGQDISLADEASDDSRKLWRALGGSPAYPQSIGWARVLRPAQFMVSRFAKHRTIAKLAAAARPALRIADALAAAIPGALLRTTIPAGQVENATPEELACFLQQISQRYAFRPLYDTDWLRWLLRLLQRHTCAGLLRQAIVRGYHDRKIGCFIYYAKPGGVGEVLQVAAMPGSHEAVLQHVFLDAWRHGVAALSGRLEPELVEEVRKQHCLLHNRGVWTLVHSRNPEILQAIHCGDVFLTRLEGEYYSHFSEAVFSRLTTAA